MQVLNTAQACAAYAAMCAMNNVNGLVDIRLDSGSVNCKRVYENDDGSVVVCGNGFERYASQDAFAKAYSIAD